MLQVADALAETIVVLDEAYLDFSSTRACVEAASGPIWWSSRHIEAFGFAAPALAVHGNPALIGLAARALPPYPPTSLSIEAAMAR